jgi:hypothetical protein
MVYSLSALSFGQAKSWRSSYSVPVHLASVREEKEKVLDFLAFFASLREISCAQRRKERKGKHRRAGFQPAGYTVTQLSIIYSLRISVNPIYTIRTN